MNIQAIVNPVVQQLAQAILQLQERDYNFPSAHLSNATIGQHVRHVVELYNCLLNGYKTGFVNYDNRKRDKSIEQDLLYAHDLLQQIILDIKKPDKQLILQANNNGICIELETNYYRELLYNLEHTIHHMALIRVGINDVCEVKLSNDFGVAASTIKYRNEVIN